MNKLLLALSTLLFPFSTFAADFMAQDFVSIQEPITGDMYAAGERIMIDSQIDGDIYIGGADVTVSGDVAEDLGVAGGRIVLEGVVGDDVRLFAGQVDIRSDVGGDLIVFGGSVRVYSDTVVRGDLIVMGGEVVVDGTVNGSLVMYGGEIVLSGRVNGDADFKADYLQISGVVAGNTMAVAKRMEFQDGASLAGDLEYWTKSDLATEGIVAGTATMNEELKGMKGHRYQKKEMAEKLMAAIMGFIFFKLISAAILMLILILATKTYFVDAASTMRKTPGMSFVYGLLFFLATPIVALVLMMTIVGIPLALLLFFGYLFSVYFASMVTAITFARYYQQHIKAKKWGNLAVFGVSLLIYILLKVLLLIPLLGWIAVGVAICMAFGALMQEKHKRYLKIR